MNEEIKEYLRAALRDSDHIGIDPWLDGIHYKAFEAMKDKKLVNFNGINYTVKLSKGGGVGMGQYPPRIQIYKTIPYVENDIVNL